MRWIVTLTWRNARFHTGRGGYIDTKTIGADGRSYAEETAQAIVDIIDQHTAVAGLAGVPVKSDLARVCV